MSGDARNDRKPFGTLANSWCVIGSSEEFRNVTGHCVKARYNVLCENMVHRRVLEPQSPTFKVDVITTTPLANPIVNIHCCVFHVKRSNLSIRSATSRHWLSQGSTVDIISYGFKYVNEGLLVVLQCDNVV